ncbi:MAG TPA: alpha/beta fold hydrolase [Bacteroidales bacterium]|nr:alpha/beta fold hydrolase [Bacteroidales bacterium]
MRPIKLFSLLFVMAATTSLFSQEQSTNQKLDEIIRKLDDMQHRFSLLDKAVDDLLWFQRAGDIAFIDKVYILGPPRAVVKNPTAMGVNNPVRFMTYIFIPRDIDPSKKYPLIVLPHGGVHGDFNTYYIHIIRELMAQQYIVVAPEYRGSIGYGKRFMELIDYGGLENEDVYASRNYMVENYEMVDPNRVGIIGWSHGGMIALMNAFEYPDDYQVVFAGVPVSDLVARMGYMTDDYRKLFSADYHIGKTANENIAEYRRRSPVYHAHKLEIPLLIHANTNDDDVHFHEVEHLIRALKAEDKDFEYTVFEDFPGGHSFDRIDTRAAREIRLSIYSFLARYLKPPRVLQSIRDIDRAAYRAPEWYND